MNPAGCMLCLRVHLVSVDQSSSFFSSFSCPLVYHRFSINFFATSDRSSFESVCVCVCVSVFVVVDSCAHGDSETPSLPSSFLWFPARENGSKVKIARSAARLPLSLAFWFCCLSWTIVRRVSVGLSAFFSNIFFLALFTRIVFIKYNNLHHSPSLNNGRRPKGKPRFSFSCFCSFSERIIILQSINQPINRTNEWSCSARWILLLEFFPLHILHITTGTMTRQAPELGKSFFLIRKIYLQLLWRLFAWAPLSPGQAREIGMSDLVWMTGQPDKAHTSQTRHAWAPLGSSPWHTHVHCAHHTVGICPSKLLNHSWQMSNYLAYHKNASWLVSESKYENQVQESWYKSISHQRISKGPNLLGGISIWGWMGKILDVGCVCFDGFDHWSPGQCVVVREEVRHRSLPFPIISQWDQCPTAPKSQHTSSTYINNDLTQTHSQLARCEHQKYRFRWKAVQGVGFLPRKYGMTELCHF